MGTEIIGIIAFLVIAITIAFVWVKISKSILISVIGSAVTVVVIVQLLNYLWIDELQLMSAQQLAFTGGIPALITLALTPLRKKKKVSSKHY